jgi:hypothetical protein
MMASSSFEEGGNDRADTGIQAKEESKHIDATGICGAMRAIRRIQALHLLSEVDYLTRPQLCLYSSSLGIQGIPSCDLRTSNCRSLKYSAFSICFTEITARDLKG